MSSPVAGVKMLPDDLPAQFQRYEAARHLVGVVGHWKFADRHLFRWLTKDPWPHGDSGREWQGAVRRSHTRRRREHCL